MYSIIVPITIEYVNVFNIQNAKSLGQIAICAARLNIQSEKLWEAIFKKLDSENIYKYLNHVQVVNLLASLVDQGTYINHPLIAKLSGVVAQQKAYYQHFPNLLGLIRATNEVLKAKAPQTLEISEALKQVAWTDKKMIISSNDLLKYIKFWHFEPIDLRKSIFLNKS